MPQAPQPAIAFDALTERLQFFFANEEELTKFDLVSLKRDARALLETDEPDHGWVAMIGIAALEWDAALARSLAVRATTAIGRSSFLYSNIAVSFRNLNLLQDAYEYSAVAYEIAPMELRIIKDHCSDLANLGRFDDAIGVWELYINRLGPQAEAAEVAKDELVAMKRCAEGLAFAGVSQEQVGRELGLALQVLHDNRRRAADIQYMAIPQPEGDVVFLAEIGVKGASFEDEMRFGAALASLLAQAGSWDPSSLLIDFKRVPPREAPRPAMRLHGHVAA